MPTRLILIRGGLAAVERLVEDYKKLIYRYNSLISKTGFYLKPVHVVTRETKLGKLRYIYVGRYWWRLEYAGRRGSTSRVRWIYVGREKPAELRSYPDPPRHPAAGLVYAVVPGSRDIVVRLDVYRRYRWLFEGLKALIPGSDEPSP